MAILNLCLCWARRAGQRINPHVIHISEEKFWELIFLLIGLYRCRGGDSLSSCAALFGLKN